MYPVNFENGEGIAVVDIGRDFCNCQIYQNGIPVRDTEVVCGLLTELLVQNPVAVSKGTENEAEMLLTKLGMVIRQD